MGQQRPRDASDLLPPPAARASATGARLYAVDPRRTSLGRVGRRAGSASTSGSDIALANAIGARDHRRRAREPRVHRPRDRRTSRPTGRRSSRTRSSTPSARPASRPTAIRELAHAFATAPRAMICWTLGITEHHNAVDNVAGADQPRPADRPRRPLRQRRQPAAWPEQRPGRRRHGRPARPAARLPARRERRAAREVRRRVGRRRSRPSAAGTCRACSTRWSAAT